MAQRADAQRNYQLVLAIAKQVFAKKGPEAPLDEVARKAGLGNATLYRHFPSRQALIIAVYADEVAELVARGEALRESEPAGDALFEWLRMFLGHITSKRDLASAPPNGRDGQPDEEYERWQESMRSITAALLRRAQRAGEVRTNLRVPDLLLMMRGIALVSTDTKQAERLLRTVRTGMAVADSAVEA